MLLVVLITFLGTSSCGTKPVEFTPDFYTADYLNELIINEDGETVQCSEQRFNDYICTHFEKITELADILSVARVPWYYKKRKEELVKQLRNKMKALE